MKNSESSTNLRNRLRDGVRSGRFGSESNYVQHVRAYVADLPDSGSQQHRLRQQDENWLVSQYRWIVEHRAHGTEWAKIRRVLQATVDEIDVMVELESIVGSITPDLVEAAKVETAVGHFEDMATLDALVEKSPGAYRRLADFCNRQIEALRMKGRHARTLAAQQLGSAR